MRKPLGVQHSLSLMCATILIGALLLPSRRVAAQDSSSVPIYMRIDSGWLGLFGTATNTFGFRSADNTCSSRIPITCS